MSEWVEVREERGGGRGVKVDTLSRVNPTLSGAPAQWEAAWKCMLDFFLEGEL